jgi:hypothetical protein
MTCRLKQSPAHFLGSFSMIQVELELVINDRWISPSRKPGVRDESERLAGVLMTLLEFRVIKFRINHFCAICNKTKHLLLSSHFISILFSDF